MVGAQAQGQVGTQGRAESEQDAGRGCVASPVATSCGAGLALLKSGEVYEQLSHLSDYGQRSGAPVALYRLANVFGKWSRPNYNSAVATFCHNIARGLPIRIDNPAAPVRLVTDMLCAMVDRG